MDQATLTRPTRFDLAYEWAKQNPQSATAREFIVAYTGERGASECQLAAVERIRQAVERTAARSTITFEQRAQSIQAAAEVAPATEIARQDESILPKPAKPEVNRGDQSIVWSGRYTLVTVDGHRTFRIRIQPSDADFAPGATVISYLGGSDNHEDGDYVDFGFVKPGNKLVVWKRFRGVGSEQLVQDAEMFLADPTSEHVTTVKQCARCGDDLTVPLSVKRGFGPTCWSKGLR